MLLPKQFRPRNLKHRKWIATRLRCILTGQTECQCAHLSKGRYSQNKAGDNKTIPLSIEKHRVQTLWQKGEGDFWDMYGGIDSVFILAQDLWENSGNDEMGESLIDQWQLNYLGKIYK